MLHTRHFEPHPLLVSGHAQTVAGVCRTWNKCPGNTIRHKIELPDEQALILHEDRPPIWREHDPSVLLVHGLAGCHDSNYMRRIMGKLHDRGYRVWRIDLLGSGAGAEFAAFGAHCGSWRDLEPVILKIAKLAPKSALAVIGFSLGAGLALNLAADVGKTTLGNWHSVMAVCPPIDLPATADHLSRGLGIAYDKFFTRQLWRRFAARAKVHPAAPHFDGRLRPRRLREFDDRLTAPIAGFASADDYYRRTSVAPRLAEIDMPTLIVATADDPILPVEPVAAAQLGRRTERLITDRGGHLGFVARRGIDRDRRWIDWRVIEFVESTLGNQSALRIHPVCEASP